MVWSGLVWLRIGASGGLLWTRWWTFRFHKMLGSSWVAAHLDASQEGISCVRNNNNNNNNGIVMVEEISFRIHTAAARVRPQASSSELCGGRSGTVAGITQVLLFLLPILVPQTTPRVL
jgi:hypothetical protein